MTKDFDLGTIQVQESTGFDAFMARQPEVVTPKTARKKVASLADLAGFVRIGTDTLVHKADKDLWSIKRQSDGSMFVERMFDDTGEPLHV